MADFATRKKFTTVKPQLSVVGTLPVGKHTFQLVVVDDSGNVSRPVKAVVEITPVILGPFVPIDSTLRLSPIVIEPTPIIR